MSISGLRFRISGQPYRQIVDWQANTDHAILIHQLRTRGQALVTNSLVKPSPTDGVLKIREVPEQGRYQPYYGSNGPYRFTFQPMIEGCRLEVFNQMGGFAFYAPERIDPLNLYLFQPVEELPAMPDLFKDDAPDEPMFVHDREGNQLIFTLSGPAYSSFTNWAWSRRALHAYHFIFTPTHEGCEARVFARESGVTLDLISQESL